MEKLYLVANSHLDPVWLWRWQDGFAEILATYKSALDRLDEIPDLKFTTACGEYYEWIEKIDPDMFKRIQEMVKSGRWSIAGGWPIQPDCNIPSGESFARHSLISQRYFNEKFNTIAKTGYNVDSFGHNASLPKILRQSGMENYVFLRPDYKEMELEKDLFYWESDDGSRVSVYRIYEEFNIDSNKLELLKRVYSMNRNEYFDRMIFFGVGNHGGGPTLKLIREIEDMKLENMVYSTPDEYFSEVDKKDIPVVKTDLQHHARGCYSACSFVKSNNRRCEQTLIAAEKFAVMAKELLGLKYPAKKFKKAWKNLLFNQFHDILGGCSIKPAYEDAGYLFGEAMSIAEQEINTVMQAISWNIDTLGDATLPSYRKGRIWSNVDAGTPVVVFNPHPWSVTMPVEVYDHPQRITDFEGNEVPFGKVRGFQTNMGTDTEYTLFNATVKPYGYTVYRLFSDKESETVFEKELSVTENTLENSRIRVEFDKITGDICSFYDKKSDKYVISSPCRAVILDETDCDTWAHGVKTLGEVCGCFGSPEFKIVENSFARGSLKVTTHLENSVLERTYHISPGSEVITVKSRVNFNEPHRTLKFTFPAGDSVTARIPYGTITKELYTGEEPMQMWFSTGGLCVANDSKYAYDTEDGEVRMTVLRTAVYADHYGQSCRDEFCEYMDMGVSEFTYSVFPDMGRCGNERRACELNFPLRSIVGSFHKGKLPEDISCISIDCDNVFVSAIKQSEDSDKNVIRFFELDGNDTDVKISLFDKEIGTKIGHNGIKTLDEDSEELNFMEW